MGRRVEGPAETRFWARVNKSTLTGCWEWTASLNTDGYGQFWFEKRVLKAHRYSYLIHFGPIPKGLIACHKCHNRKCVRPDHLYAGTNQDNANDAVASGRVASGTKRLSPETKRLIVALRKQGMTLVAVAAELGINLKTVQRHERLARCA